MALITCSECGGQVSSTAAACPHCGAPVSVELNTPAVEERKCEDCGTVLPEGAAACPQCGCPAEIKPSQPAPAPVPRPAYVAPTVAPATARAQLGSAKLRIEETVAKRTALANTWLFLATAASFVMYIVAFVRYMDFFNNVEEYKKKWYVQLGAAVVNKTTDGKAEDFFIFCTFVKSVVICALVIAAIAFIGGLVQLSKKKRMSQCLWVFPILDIAGFWIPIGILSGLTGFKEEQIQNILDFITDKDFGTYIGIASIVIVFLFFISVGVVASVPKVTDFCSSCGRKTKNEGAGGICKGCGERKYIFGFTPIPREIVAAYPYSGETLVGKSPVRRIHVFGVVLVDIMILSIVISFAVMVGKENGFNISQLFVIVIALAIVAGISVIAFRNGASDNITVTPTSVKLISINGPGKLNVSVSQITDVLTNESGDLAVCALGRAFVFTDLSGRAQIAAALETLTSKNQMN